MKPFHESLRHDYPLTPDSLVVEIGGYCGAWAKTMAEKHGCRVLTFEPVKRFYEQAVMLMKLAQLGERVRVENCGVSEFPRQQVLYLHGELTGANAEGEAEEVRLIGIDDLLSHPWVAGRIIDVLSVNCEGEEYAILDGLMTRGAMSMATNLQVQFHSVAMSALKRRESLRQRLRITHRPAWEIPEDMDNTWDGWEVTA